MLMYKKYTHKFSLQTLKSAYKCRCEIKSQNSTVLNSAYIYVELEYTLNLHNAEFSLRYAELQLQNIGKIKTQLYSAYNR